jgi:hypothetical protein
VESGDAVIPAEGATLLTWDGVIPIAFVPGSAVTDDRMIAHRVAANLRVLHTCEALEERRAEIEEDLSGAPESVRLERKIDLLIELVGHWVSRSGLRPAAAVARLSVGGVSWSPGAPVPSVGAVGSVELFLREGVAESLRLPGRIVAMDPDGQVTVAFVALSEAEGEALERFIFRQHRRTVAVQRRAV